MGLLCLSGAPPLIAAKGQSWLTTLLVVHRDSPVAHGGLAGMTGQVSWGVAFEAPSGMCYCPPCRRYDEAGPARLRQATSCVSTQHSLPSAHRPASTTPAETRLVSHRLSPSPALAAQRQAGRLPQCGGWTEQPALFSFLFFFQSLLDCNCFTVLC